MKKILGLTFALAMTLSNLQGLRGEETQGEQRPWSSSIGFGYNTTRGNSETNNLALTFQAIREVKKTKWSTNANVTYATTEGDATANRGGVKTQYDVKQTDRVFYFGKAGFEYDKFAQLDLRTSPGAGVGYIVMKEEKTNLSVSTGANFVTDFFSDDTKDSRGTLSISEELSHALTSTAGLIQTFNIQNNFEDFGDYLIDVEVSLTTKVSENLALKASLLDKYDSDPFSEELKKNDITFLTSLNYSF